MRLLDVETGQFVEKDPERTVYAILSHTWDTENGEQTYKELKKIQRRYGTRSHLSPKIREACAVARAHGYRYIWIDSCCIDKSSSSELSEAINSMYAWYAIAGVCYAYLADVPPGDDHEAQGSRFRKSWWFTRGWTLQELIAPVNVVFLSVDWAPIGSKHALGSLVESVTKIDYQALLHLEPLHKFSVAQRLLWAANRKTTRKEDRAYSLLGIFDIHMPTLYGEGDRAFRRLQEQIMQRIPDQSLFAWG
ncbi:heterokaryon incompatibility protein-domain-containing protein, partial [Ganoderma leucocontextum]